MRLTDIARVRFDLGLAVLLAVFGLLLSLWADAPGAVRLIVGGPVVLVVPGYAVSVALLPDATMDWPTRALVTGGLSIACLAIAGLGLNATRFGLTGVSWAATICAITIVSAVIAIVRSRRLASSVTTPALGGGGRLSAWQTAVFGVAGVTLVGAMWLAITPVAEQPQQGYTLLWALPRDSDQAGTVQIGVRSLEAGPTSYHLQIVSGNDVVRDVALSLNPADEWDADLSLPDDGSGAYEARLYRDDSPGVVYRRVQVRMGAQS